MQASKKLTGINKKNLSSLPFVRGGTGRGKRQ